MKVGMYPATFAGYTRVTSPKPNEEPEMPSKISRRYSFRGQRVMVELRDGGTVTGTLVGWGPSIMQLRVDVPGSETGKYRELSNSQRWNVYNAS